MSSVLPPPKANLIAFTTSAVKALPNRMFEGYLIRYYKNGQRDAQWEWFDDRTNYMKGVYPIVGRPVLFDHGFNASIGAVPIGEYIYEDWRDDGLFVKGVNDFARIYKAYLAGLTAPDRWLEDEERKAQAYEEYIQQMIDRGMLGQSAGAVPPSVIVDKRTKHIDQWGTYEGSLTRMECDPRRVAAEMGYQVNDGTRVYPMKAIQSVVKNLPTEALIGSFATGEVSQTGKSNISINLSTTGANLMALNTPTKTKGLEEIIRQHTAAMMRDIMTELSSAQVQDDAGQPMAIPTNEPALEQIITDETMRAVGEQPADVEEGAVKSLIDTKYTDIIEASVNRYMTEAIAAHQKRQNATKSAFNKWAMRQPAPDSNSVKSQAGGFHSQFNINTGAVKATLLDVVQAQAGIDPFNFRGKSNPLNSALEATVHGGMKSVTGQIGQNAGFRTNALIAKDFIEPLYNDTVLNRVGARPRTFPAGTRQITVRKRNSAASAAFGGEGQTTNGSNVNDGYVTFNLRPLVVEYVVSQEELKFADADFEQQLIADAQEVGSIRIDASALRGSGAVVGSEKGAELLGVRNWSGVAATSLSGSAVTYDQLIGMKTNILNRKIKESDSWSYVFNHNIEKQLETMKDTTNQPIFAPFSERIERRIRGVPYQTTLQVPSNLGAGSNKTEIYCGDWKFLELARITEEMEVATDPSVLRRSREVLIQLVIYVDAAVTRPEAFEIYYDASQP